LKEKKIHPIAVLISGGGTNLQSIIDSCQNGAIPCEVVLVISNREEAYGLTRAKNHGIEGIFLDHRQFPTREAFEEKLISLIERVKAELVCLAGFMRVLTPRFVNHFRGKLMNIHPALLPSFPGTHGQKQALDYGVKIFWSHSAFSSMRALTRARSLCRQWFRCTKTIRKIPSEREFSHRNIRFIPSRFDPFSRINSKSREERFC